MKISVIIPTLNSGTYIERSIESVLRQNYKDKECIVVDGVSTDSTVSILKRYRGKIIWVSEKDSGISQAINRGIKLSSGQILTVLGSDDILPDNVLRRVSIIFKNKRGTKWVTGDYLILDPRGRSIQNLVRIYKKIFRSIPFKKLTLFFANYIVQPCTFFRTDLVEEIGYYNEDLKYAADYDFWLRLIKKYPPFVTRKTLVHYTIHPASLRASSYKKITKEATEIVKKHTASWLLRGLNKMHGALINFFYSVLQAPA